MMVLGRKEEGMGTPEIDLNALAEGLPASEVAEVADFIAWKKARRESLMKSAQAWHESLPTEDEEISSEEEDAVQAAKAEAGSIPWEQVKAELGL
ncbi:hypothetical protein D3C86_1814660 [compost metagenome]